MTEKTVDKRNKKHNGNNDKNNTFHRFFSFQVTIIKDDEQQRHCRYDGVAHRKRQKKNRKKIQKSDNGMSVFKSAAFHKSERNNPSPFRNLKTE